MNGISLLHSCSLCCHAMLLLCGDTKNSCLDQAPHWGKKEKKILFHLVFCLFRHCRAWSQARVVLNKSNLPVGLCIFKFGK